MRLQSFSASAIQEVGRCVRVGQPRVVIIIQDIQDSIIKQMDTPSAKPVGTHGISEPRKRGRAEKGRPMGRDDRRPSEKAERSYRNELVVHTCVPQTHTDAITVTGCRRCRARVERAAWLQTRFPENQGRQNPPTHPDGRPCVMHYPVSHQVVV